MNEIDAQELRQEIVIKLRSIAAFAADYAKWAERPVSDEKPDAGNYGLDLPSGLKLTILSAPYLAQKLKDLHENPDLVTAIADYCRGSDTTCAKDVVRSVRLALYNADQSGDLDRAMICDIPAEIFLCCFLPALSSINPPLKILNISYNGISYTCPFRAFPYPRQAIHFYETAEMGDSGAITPHLATRAIIQLSGDAPNIPPDMLKQTPLMVFCANAVLKTRPVLKDGAECLNLRHKRDLSHRVRAPMGLLDATMRHEKLLENSGWAEKQEVDAWPTLWRRELSRG